MAYKPDQGRLVRLAAFWSLAILILYGCNSLHTELSSYWPGDDGRPILGKAIAGLRIPILGADLSPALLIALLVLGAAWFLLHRWQNSPKIADLLIETEAELRKVTWPTMPEALNSSVIVIVCVAFLMAFLAGSDWWLGRLTTWLLLGGGG